MRPSTLLLYLLLACTATACLKPIAYQAPLTAQALRYGDFLGEGEYFVSESYNSLVSSNALGQYIYRQFFPETLTLTYYTEYKDAKLHTKDGVAKTWHENGNKDSEGQYYIGNKEGQWEYYHYSNGNLYSKGIYINDKKEGLWTYFALSGYKSAEKLYEDDELHGTSIKYDSLGVVVWEGEYNRGDLLPEYSVESTDIQEEPYLAQFADLPTADQRKEATVNTLLKKIYSSINYPKVAIQNNIEGTTYSQFLVKKDGSIGDILVKRGLCAAFVEENRRVINALDMEWKPGTINGEAVDVLFTLPIRYKLQ